MLLLSESTAVSSTPTTNNDIVCGVLEVLQLHTAGPMYILHQINKQTYSFERLKRQTCKHKLHCLRVTVWMHLYLLWCHRISASLTEPASAVGSYWRLYANVSGTVVEIKTDLDCTAVDVTRLWGNCLGVWLLADCRKRVMFFGCCFRCFVVYSMWPS